MTPDEFMVDLAALKDATGKVSTQLDNIENLYQQIKTTVLDVESHWVSPAGNSFQTAWANFQSVYDQLIAVGKDAVDRMNVAYNNYVATEQGNTSNLQ
jgi:WXG100 family type VII secretion target